MVTLRDRLGGAQARQAVADDRADGRLGSCYALQARSACRAMYLTAAAVVPALCRCTFSSVQCGSRILGAELAEEAAVVGCDVLFDESSLVVEAEDVHEVHDDTGTGGFEPPGG